MSKPTFFNPTPAVSSDGNTPICHHNDGTGQFIFATANIAAFLMAVYFICSHCSDMGYQYGTERSCSERGTPSDRAYGDILLLFIAFSSIFVAPMSSIGLRDPRYYLKKLFLSSDEDSAVRTCDESCELLWANRM